MVRQQKCDWVCDPQKRKEMNCNFYLFSHVSMQCFQYHLQSLLLKKTDWRKTNDRLTVSKFSLVMKILFVSLKIKFRSFSFSFIFSEIVFNEQHFFLCSICWRELSLWPIAVFLYFVQKRKKWKRKKWSNSNFDLLFLLTARYWISSIKNRLCQYKSKFKFLFQSKIITRRDMNENKNCFHRNKKH